MANSREPMPLTGKPRRVEIFRRLSEIIEPKSDLEFSSIFELLVAVTLSAQATDKQVNKVTRVLFAKANTPEAIFALGVAGLEHEIRSIGLFRSKAKNVHKTCGILLEKYDGQVPEKRSQLEELPGVGKKTAGVVLNVGFNKPTIPVDTHVFRLSHRLGLTRAKTPDKTEEALNRAVPKEYRLTAHHLLILHGRYVCKARTPLCGECVIADLCRSKDKVTPEKLEKAKKTAAKAKRTSAKAKKTSAKAKKPAVKIKKPAVKAKVAKKPVAKAGKSSKEGVGDLVLVKSVSKTPKKRRSNAKKEPSSAKKEPSRAKKQAAASKNAASRGKTKTVAKKRRGKSKLENE